MWIAVKKKHFTPIVYLNVKQNIEWGKKSKTFLSISTDLDLDDFEKGARI